MGSNVAAENRQRSKKRRIPQQPQHNASNPLRSNEISCGFSLQKLFKTTVYKKEKEDVRVPACGYSRWMNEAAAAIDSGK